MESKNTNTNTTFTVDDVTPRLELFTEEEPNLGEFCSIKYKFIKFGTVPILTGLYNAYTHHCPLKFTPDDFWLLILQEVSYYISANSKKLRYKLVNFEGKKEIKAFVPVYLKKDLKQKDYKDCIKQVVSKMPKLIKDKKLVNTLTQQFSTSNEDNLTVKQLCVMFSFKDFFNYRFVCYGCGIPSISLTGKVEDYEKILKSLDELIKLDPNLKKIKPIMQKVLDTKKGKIDKEFWKNMIKKNVSIEEIYASAAIMGRKKTDSISGWILDFINYDNKGRPLDKFELDYEIYVKYIPNKQSQILKTKFVLEDYYHKTYDMAVCAGFLGMKQDPKTYEMSTVIGWYIEDYDEEKMKQDAENLYYEIHKDDEEGIEYVDEDYEDNDY